MLEVLKAILFGIIEGITEWLPISSTGHLILIDEVFKLQVSNEFYEMFQVVIQLGNDRSCCDCCGNRAPGVRYAAHHRCCGNG